MVRIIIDREDSVCPDCPYFKNGRCVNSDCSGSDFVNRVNDELDEVTYWLNQRGYEVEFKEILNQGGKNMKIAEVIETLKKSRDLADEKMKENVDYYYQHGKTVAYDDAIRLLNEYRRERQ